jgi:hypothetical protein
MEVTVESLQQSLSAKEQTITALSHENSLLKQQMQFFKDLLSLGGSALPMFSLGGASSSSSSSSAAGPRTPAVLFGLLCLTLCVLPFADVQLTNSTASAMPHPAQVSTAGSAPSATARLLLSVPDDDHVQHAPASTSRSETWTATTSTAAPPLPSDRGVVLRLSLPTMPAWSTVRYDSKSCCVCVIVEDGIVMGC